MGNRRGRKPSNEPATAYDYRRAIALVQVLATYDEKKVLELCRMWEVHPIQTASRHLYPTIVALAQHALEHQRDGE